MKEEDKKEGHLKRLKNIETNKKNNNDEKYESSLYSSQSSARIESSIKILTSDGDEKQTSFEYLWDSTDEFFGGYADIFDSYLK